MVVSSELFLGLLASLGSRSRLPNGWLEIGHGGGSGLPSVVESAVGHFQRCIRVAALLDSDRLIPGQHTAAHDKSDRLREVGATVHVLDFREAENYAPNRVLAATGRRNETSRKLTFLKLLSPEQRGFFDMKKGFGPMGEPPKVPAMQEQLFDGLSDTTRLGLRGGFGPDILRTMEAISGTLVRQDIASIGASVVGELESFMAKLMTIS